jgi:GABA(A) receptor-associated protein
MDEFHRINSKFPGKIPIICEIDKKDTQIDVKGYTMNKYLVDTDLTVGQFMYVVRKRIKIPPEKAIFLTVGNGIIPPIGELISNIYHEHKDPEDHFLYFFMMGENFFG